MQKFRKSLPEGTEVFICKNNLMKVAVGQSDGWGQLSEKGCQVRLCGNCHTATHFECLFSPDKISTLAG